MNYFIHHIMGKNDAIEKFKNRTPKNSYSLAISASTVKKNKPWLQT